MIDLAQIVDFLIPNAKYGTARKTDLDTDDYAAQERTWHDPLPIPDRETVDETRLMLELAASQRDLERANRMAEFLSAIQDQPPQVTAAEIIAASSLADIKFIIAKLARSQRLFRAVFAILRNREDVANDG